MFSPINNTKISKCSQISQIFDEIILDEHMIYIKFFKSWININLIIDF